MAEVTVVAEEAGNPPSRKVLHDRQVRLDPLGAHSAEEMLKDAELAMYHSKRIGGDRIDVYKPAMRARKTDRLTLESELRRAIERQEITILYQPIVISCRSMARQKITIGW